MYQKRRYRRRYNRPYRRRISRGLSYSQRRQVNTIVSRKLEKKYHDVSLSNAVTIGGTIDILSAINQGTTDIERIGDKLKFKSLNIICDWSNIADVFNVCRVIIFQWHVNNSVTVPTVGDILQDNTVPWKSMYNHDYGSNFTVLYDKVTCTSEQYGMNIKCFKIRITNKKKRKVYTIFKIFRWISCRYGSDIYFTGNRFWSSS